MLWKPFVSALVTSNKRFPKIRSFSGLISADEVNFAVPFMFPGQGAQFVGMAKSLCEEHAAARQLFESASAILGYDLYSLCVNGPKSSLDSTVISQPAIFVSSMAALEKLKAENRAAFDQCTVAMGLSLGEYSALCFAGAFSFEDGVKLTKARGEAMQSASDAVSSGMVAAIGASRSQALQLCNAAAEKSGHSIVIGNNLCDGNYVLSGHASACLAARELGKSFGARLIPLPVSGAFHSSFMESAVPLLKRALDEVQISVPRLPVIANVDAQPKYTSDDIRDALLKQVVSPVMWEDIMNKILQSPHFKKGFEIGPGTVCRGIAKKMRKDADVESVF